MRDDVCLLWSNRSKVQRGMIGVRPWGHKVRLLSTLQLRKCWEDLGSTHSSEGQIEKWDVRHTACTISLTSSILQVNKWPNFSYNFAMYSWIFGRGQIRQKLLKTGMWVLDDQTVMSTHFRRLLDSITQSHSFLYFLSVKSDYSVSFFLSWC